METKSFMIYCPKSLFFLKRRFFFLISKFKLIFIFIMEFWHHWELNPLSKKKKIYLICLFLNCILSNIKSYLLILNLFNLIKKIKVSIFLFIKKCKTNKINDIITFIFAEEFFSKIGKIEVGSFKSNYSHSYIFFYKYFFLP